MVVLIMYVMFEVGRMLFVQNTLDLAVQEAARWATANPAATPLEIEDVALRAMDMAGTAAFTATIKAGDGLVPQFVSVEGQLRYQMMLPLLPDAMVRMMTAGEGATGSPDALALQARARMPVLN